MTALTLPQFEGGARGGRELQTVEKIIQRISTAELPYPLKASRMVGLVCATFGALIWGAVDTILIYHACNIYIHS